MSVGTLELFTSHNGGKNTKTKKRLFDNVVSIFTVVFTWMERARSRHELAKLDDHMLHDIGLSRADVVGEIEKPFWVK